MKLFYMVALVALFFSCEEVVQLADALHPADTMGDPDALIPADTLFLLNHQRQTEVGIVAGVREGNVWVFRGIPYAAPPVRFHPPAPHPGWTGVREAQDFGPPCTQLAGTPPQVVGQEDCLTLNVWTPGSTSAAARPVMVWFHGGDNVAGAAFEGGFFSEEPMYDGRRLVLDGDVVFVSVQYRLGAFGFLSHPDFAKDNALGASGNWGLMDQLRALEWVRDNIAQFGGDPARVLIFGQSAGGDDVCALVASKRATGLFERAIVMSAGGCHTNDAQVSAGITKAVVNVLGCENSPDEVTCLRNLPADQVARAPQEGAPLHPNRIDFYVEIDGYVLTEPPIAAFLGGRHNEVEVIWGTTADEYALIFSEVFPTPFNPGQYTAWMEELFGPVIAPDAAAFYSPADYGGHIPALIAAHGDAVHHCSTRADARALAGHQTKPTYRYLFSHTFNDSRLASFGAAHGFDIPFVFGNRDGLTWTPEEDALSATMLEAWTRFAHGLPPHPKWPVYDVGTDAHAMIEQGIVTAQGVRTNACDFWDSVWGNE